MTSSGGCADEWCAPFAGDEGIAELLCTPLMCVAIKLIRIVALQIGHDLYNFRFAFSCEVLRIGVRLRLESGMKMKESLNLGLS